MTAPTPARLRPVVALDVDGVLNPEEHQPGYLVHEVHVPADQVPDSPFVRGYGQADMNVVVRLNPDHGAWINRLSEHADVVWATTWEHCANTHLAPLLGADPLPVGISTAAHPPRFGDARNGNATSWKSGALNEEFAGRPLVWVDDYAGAYQAMLTEVDDPDDDWEPTWLDALEDEEDSDEPEWRFDAKATAPTLVVVPDARVGLTEAHMAAVEAFIAEHAG